MFQDTDGKAEDMTDLEYDILDELYFIQPYAYLLDTLELDNAVLKENLGVIIEKGWVKCFRQDNTEVFTDDLAFELHYRNYLYLATKRGLMAHNAGD